MKVLFTTLREKTHFLPMLPFIEALQRQGHAVGVAAPPDFADRVAAAGATFFPFGHPGDEGLRPIWARFAGASEEDLKRIAIGELFAGACAGAAIPKLLETLETWRPALVARETHEFAGLLAAEKAGIPHARIAIVSRRAEDQIAALASASVDAHRRTWSLPADPQGDRMRAEVALTLFPASFEDRETPPALRIRFRTDHSAAKPLPDWWPGRQGPFVYVTLGTGTGRFQHMHDRYRAALDTLGALPIRALLTIGSDLPLETLGEVPPNVHVERFVPQDDVLPHAAAVLNHGGSGTVLGVLAAGVPQVVAPIFADQPDNAIQAQTAGVGLALPAGSVSQEQLRTALTRVLEEPSFRIAAKKLAAEIAALPFIDEVATVAARLART